MPEQCCHLDGDNQCGERASWAFRDQEAAYDADSASCDAHLPEMLSDLTVSVVWPIEIDW